MQLIWQALLYDLVEVLVADVALKVVMVIVAAVAAKTRTLTMMKPMTV
jgi:hypothetical protein